ncbi:PSD1 and planctomycete cytochrome C domain-containing protein [Marinilongibacter aquaticus]|uniref:PSD1 and planctomycete cytochrome C domain-containing protein n=1 Tax=Marinilongibacter aquaticus TaxID=2975157 RepID=UPI0021BDA5E3|nr:PSD1 and planctomycete cytochrome C domain-containing protein [Marinilongibacter aquaticus]UBM58951.1 PSD1 and planctomycete cytochrome C domain-containing protein [Marinilongibacter aquaticus]
MRFPTFKYALISSVLYVFLLAGCGTDEAESSNEVSYNFDIRPILSDRCFKCHGPDAKNREAGLRLDTEEGAYAALKDEPDMHAIVPGKPEISSVYLRLVAEDSTQRMPPLESNLKLSADEIDLIKKWIGQGAKYQRHWAFIAPEKQKIPEAGDDWVKNEIDHFVAKKMEKVGLEPNEEAQKLSLLKRVAFDLTGLPPTVQEQNEFMADESPEAYEKMVDRYLGNAHYGERMAQEWLDVARYADSHGYQDDGLRTMWPWRDWVIHAFNENYPYDKFVRWQLAGDLIQDKNKESVLATGFNRNHKITQEGGVIDEEYRIEYVTDRTNTFGKAFLSLTFECSHCHDHKYDPISQEEYYQTFAFFNQVPEKGIYGTIDASFADPPNISISDNDVNELLQFINKKDSSDVKVMVMADSAKMRPTYLLLRGNYDAHGQEVFAGVPKSIMKFDTSLYAPNRLGLSNWLLDKKNPLTARVFVNRLWAQFFGQGIVKTVGDFGMQGDLPSHPELLDWLAVDFMENGWNVKRLVKQMLVSATYRQSSAVSEKQLKTDPTNVYLSRSARLRLPAENVRDLVLASSGLLNDEIGGPSVKPYQPEGLWEVASSGRGLLKTYIQDSGDKLYRRGMYVFVKRTVPPPSMLIFDASNRDQCEVQRMRTNTPLQALVMLNDPHVLEASRVLAEKLESEQKDKEELLALAFQKIICRPAKSKEMDVLNSFMENEKAVFAENPKKVEEVLSAGEYTYKKKVDRTETAALARTIQLIYNMEEAITRI